MNSTVKFCLLGITSSFYSCVASYVPNATNAPLFTGRGEFQGSIYLGTAGFDPQLSYAVSDHVGIMINGSFEDRDSDSTDNFHKHRFVEAGAGYYHRFGTNEKGVFEIYGGAGFGNLEALNESAIFMDYTKVDMVRIFFQPTVGFNSEVFDGGFTPRISFVNLSQGAQNETGIFWEPTFTGKVGYRYLRFIFQTGFSVPINGDEITFGYQPFMFSVGMQFNLGRKYESDDEL